MKTKKGGSADADAREAFMEEVGGLWPLAKGSLSEARSPCVREGCRACAEGRMHKRLLYSFREDGRQRSMYVKPSQAGEVRRAVGNGRKLEALLARLGRELVLRGRGPEA